MGDKSTKSLPPIRIPEALETRLMRLAAISDRTLSEYVRLVLVRHVFGHAANVAYDDESGNHDRAKQRDAQFSDTSMGGLS